MGKFNDKQLLNSAEALEEKASLIYSGVTELNSDISDIKNTLDGKEGWFSTTLNEVLNTSEENKTFNESSSSSIDFLKNTLEKLSINVDFDSKEEKKEKKTVGKISKSSKLEDLNKLPGSLGTLGAVLVNSIDSLKEGKDNKKDKKDKGKGFSGFFKGLMEGVSGIAALAVALVAFAGATLLFNFVKWDKALGGLVAFAAFTAGAIIIAKKIKNENKTLIEFAVASVLLSGALALFSISLVLLSNIFEGKPTSLKDGLVVPAMKLLSAMAGIALFIGFEFLINALSKKVASDQKGFVEFAMGSFFMAAALGVFAISLAIVSAVMSGQELKFLGITIPKVNFWSSLLGIGLFLLFELGLAGVAKALGSSEADFVKFAKASIIMVGALVAFTLSLVLVSGIVSGDGIPILKISGIKIGWAILGIVFFTVFIGIMAGLAKLTNSFAGSFILFGITSVILSGALALFSVAMWISGAVLSPGKHKFGDLEVEGVKWTQVLTSLGIMSLFLISMGAIAAAAGVLAFPIAVGLLVLTPLLLFITGLSVAFSLLAKSLKDISELGNSNLLSTSLKSIGIVKEIIDGIKEIIPKGEAKDFEKNMKSLSKGSKYYKEAMENFSVESHAGAVESFAGSLEKLGKVNLDNLDKLSHLTKDSKLKDAADYIDKIAKGLEKIGKKSIAESLSNLSKSGAVLSSPSGISQQASSNVTYQTSNMVDNSADFDKLLSILNKWDKDGIELKKKEENRKINNINI